MTVPAILAEIRALDEKATKGPWAAFARASDQSGALRDQVQQAGLGFEIDGPPEPDLRGQFALGADAALICELRNRWPLLRAALEFAEAEVAYRKHWDATGSDADDYDWIAESGDLESIAAAAIARYRAEAARA